MKVICAGMGKTGTKSMAFALRELGYNVYDYVENYQFLRDDWERIFSKGGTTEDFRRMYSDVDAVTDVPSCFFWEEIHRAFPDAKIIFTMRENEEVWWKSLKNQVESSNTLGYKLTTILSPSLRRMSLYGQKLCIAVFGWDAPLLSLFRDPPLNELVLRMAYRRHNANVLQNAPKDKLLVYSVKDGWGPLCEFLGKEVPSTAFPRKNVRGNIIEEFFKTNPLFIRMRREAMLSSSLIVLLAAYGSYKLATGSTPFSWAKFWVSTAQSLVGKLKL